MAAIGLIGVRSQKTNIAKHMETSPSPRPAELTIGLPVRNGGSLLKIAIDSLLNQTFRDFILVISDNASDDQTQSVCERYAALDERIRYVRQPVNIGNPGNFRFTLMQANSPFFMWAAHDDIWLPEFAERNIALLKNDPAAAASVSQVEFFMPDGGVVVSTGTAPITGTPNERVSEYFRLVGDSSRFYAVFRTEIIKRSYPVDAMVYGFDWIISALVLVEGSNVEVPKVLLRRMPQAPDHYFRSLLKQVETKWIDRVFPFRRLTLQLRKHLPPAIWRSCAWSIYRYNVIVCLRLLEYRMPALRPVINTIARVEAFLRRL